MPEVASVSEADYAELASFLAAFPDDESASAESWLSRMRAWWDLNPAYVDALTRGWMLRENGRIVGFLGSIPWRFRLGGNDTTVFAGTTWRVLPEFRGMSIVLKRRQMDEHRDVLHFSTTPRPEVARILKLMEYERIRRGTGTETHTAILLNFEKILRIKFRNSAWNKAIARSLAPPLRAYQSIRMRRLKHHAHENVRELESAGEAFDDLWDRTRARYPSTNVRTAEAVNWYCFSSTEFEKKLFGYFEGEKLTGYIVFLSTERRGMKFFECVDLWIEPASGRDEVLGALIEKGRQSAERGSFDRIHLPHFNRETAASYRNLGLLEMNGRRKPGFYKGPRQMMDQLKPPNSYFVLAQGDYGL